MLIQNTSQVVQDNKTTNNGQIKHNSRSVRATVTHNSDIDRWADLTLNSPLNLEQFMNSFSNDERPQDEHQYDMAVHVFERALAAFVKAGVINGSWSDEALNVMRNWETVISKYHDAQSPMEVLFTVLAESYIAMICHTPITGVNPSDLLVSAEGFRKLISDVATQTIDKINQDQGVFSDRRLSAALINISQPIQNTLHEILLNISKYDLTAYQLLDHDGSPFTIQPGTDYDFSGLLSASWSIMKSGGKTLTTAVKTIGETTIRAAKAAFSALDNWGEGLEGIGDVLKTLLLIPTTNIINGVDVNDKFLYKGKTSIPFDGIDYDHTFSNKLTPVGYFIKNKYPGTGEEKMADWFLPFNFLDGLWTSYTPGGIQFGNELVDGYEHEDKVCFYAGFIYYFKSEVIRLMPSKPAPLVNGKPKTSIRVTALYAFGSDSAPEEHNLPKYTDGNLWWSDQVFKKWIEKKGFNPDDYGGNVTSHSSVEVTQLHANIKALSTAQYISEAESLVNITRFGFSSRNAINTLRVQFHGASDTNKMLAITAKLNAKWMSSFWFMQLLQTGVHAIISLGNFVEQTTLINKFRSDVNKIQDSAMRAVLLLPSNYTIGEDNWFDAKGGTIEVNHHGYVGSEYILRLFKMVTERHVMDMPGRYFERHTYKSTVSSPSKLVELFRYKEIIKTSGSSVQSVATNYIMGRIMQSLLVPIARSSHTIAKMLLSPLGILDNIPGIFRDLHSSNNLDTTNTYVEMTKVNNKTRRRKT